MFLISSRPQAPAARSLPSAQARKGRGLGEKPFNPMKFSKSLAPFRNWVLGAERVAGSWQEDAYQDHWHNIEQKGAGDDYVSGYGNGTAIRNNSLAAPTSSVGPTLWISAISIPGLYGGGLPRVTTETRPVNITQPVIIYLGGPSK